MICGLSRVLQHRVRFAGCINRPGSAFQYSEWLSVGGEGKAPAEPLSCHSEYCSIWLGYRRRIDRYGSAPLVLGGEIVSALLLEAAYATRGGSNILDCIYIGKKLLLLILAAGGCTRLCV